MAIITKILETTIASGQSVATFTDNAIPDSLIRVYSTNSNIYPQSILLSGNTLTITYEPVTSSMGVAVELVKQGLEIVDSLTSDDSDKALSAKQGKSLITTINNLGGDDISYDNTETGISAENVQSAIDEVFTYVSNGKALIAEAITDKGVETSATATFSEMAYNIEQISGGGSSASIDLVFNNGNYGSSTYTANANGLHLLLVSYAYAGSGSISLPSGRTALLSGDLLSGSRGMRWSIVELERGDVVTLTASPGSWQAFSKAIYYLTSINITSSSTLNNSVQVNDGTAQLITPNDNYKYLVCGMGMGRSGNCRNDTVETGSVIDADSKDSIGVYTVCGVYYGTGSTLPIFNFYGYDGGCGCIFSIKV